MAIEIANIYFYVHNENECGTSQKNKHYKKYSRVVMEYRFYKHAVLIQIHEYPVWI